ncbi:hypothetical protein LCGC14_0543960 [marine sediment metagenome]|uniref:Uncharacterized protein n=1 Tax=marine sediment metagenome TaxID=412755 RepID=A0A0F9SAM2_9ZZZZ
MPTDIAVNIGDHIKFWVTRTGNKPLLGTVVKAEIRYGSPYATIRPDDSEALVYLFYGAIWGFAPINEYIHPWSPQSMARQRLR